MSRMRYSIPVILVMALAGALLVAGCTSNSSPAPVTAVPATTTNMPEMTPPTAVPSAVPTLATTAPSAPATAGAAGPSSTAAVAIKGLEFNPGSVTIGAGATVTWTNFDDVPHTVTSLSPSPEKFDSGSISRGQTFSRTFTLAGTYPYTCTIHPFMKGTVVVVP
ncbi:MAG TPA: cupredoxin family copper-binding protein [Methanoregula sp.]|nr:cupredoxin family copper-binding protein [Methanoregula sp.]